MRPAVLLLIALLAPAAARAATSEDVDAAALLNGARFLSPEGNPVDEGAELLDRDPATQWEPPLRDGKKKPMLLQFAEPFDLTRLELVNAHDEDGEGLGVKKIKIESGPSAKGPWAPLLEADLKKSRKPQSFAVSATAVRFLRMTALSNHGNAEFIGLAELSAWGRRTKPHPTSFTGVWQTSYGEMVLKQEGERVTGCYAHPKQTVEGTLEGAVFSGAWHEESGGGMMAFALTAEGDLSGVWGSNPDGSDRTGRWDGTRKAKATLNCAKPESDLDEQLEKKGRVVLHGILFDTGKDVIKPESLPVLEALAKAMKPHKKRRYVIEGHTDDRGEKAANQTLSEKRAASVKAWLVKNGVQDAQLKTVGYGQTRPALPNDSDAGRAANRRVEVAKEK